MNQSTFRESVEKIVMTELHPFMCSDHKDRCIGYPDHKREVDETVEAISNLVEEEVKKALESVRDTFNLDTEDIDELNDRIAKVKSNRE